MAKILVFSSTGTLPSHRVTNGTTQGLRQPSTKSLPLHLHLLLQQHQGQQNGKVFMGCLRLVAALASGVNSIKRCWKHCHQLISIEGTNITEHVGTAWRKILKTLERESELQPSTNLLLWSCQDFTLGLRADLKQISSSWQLKPGPCPVAKQVPLKPMYFKNY